MFTVLDHAADARIRARARRRGAERVQSFARRLDWMLLLAVAGLVVYGLWAIGGVTAADERQGAYVAVGTVGLIACLFVDPDLYRRHQRVLYALLIALLLLVIATAPVVVARNAGSTSAASGSSRPSSASCCSFSPWPGSWPTAASGSWKRGRC
jgi:hypothetical protein